MIRLAVRQGKIFRPGSSYLACPTSSSPLTRSLSFSSLPDEPSRRRFHTSPTLQASSEGDVALIEEKPHKYAKSIVDKSDFDFAAPSPSISPRALGKSPKWPAGIRVNISQRHTIHPWNMRFFVGGRHPHVDVKLEKYRELTLKVPLWVQVLPHNSGGTKTKAVVRHTMLAKVRAAFRDALRLNGYDNRGNKGLFVAPTPPPSPRLTSTMAKGEKKMEQGDVFYVNSSDPAQLYGTVKINLEAIKLVDYHFPGLVEFFVAIIDRVLKKELGRPAGWSPGPIDDGDQSRGRHTNNANNRMRSRPHRDQKEKGRLVHGTATGKILRDAKAFNRAVPKRGQE